MASMMRAAAALGKRYGGIQVRIAAQRLTLSRSSWRRRCLGLSRLQRAPAFQGAAALCGGHSGHQRVPSRQRDLMSGANHVLSDQLATLPPVNASLPIFHWAFFRLERCGGSLQLRQRQDMRVFVIVSAIIVYLLFLLVAVVFMTGFERIFTVTVCCCAPVFVYMVTSTFGLEANRLLNGSIAQVNERLAQLIGSGDNRTDLAVLQLTATCGRSEALETVTVLITGYRPRPVADSLAIVDLKEVFSRDQVVLAMTGSARWFRPLLAEGASWPVPVPLVRYGGRVRIEAPFNLL
jgi:hypothetical protein